MSHYNDFVRRSLSLLLAFAVPLGGGACAKQVGEPQWPEWDDPYGAYDDGAYTALVARSIGDPVGARSELRGWTDEELRTGFIATRTNPDLPRAAAAMIHTELALEAVRDSPMTARVHLTLAEEHVRQLGSERPGFRRRWLLLRALDRLEAFDIIEARVLLKRALGEWPEQPDLLLAMGVSWEVEAKITGIELVARPDLPDTSGAEKLQHLNARQRSQLREAEAYYGRTLAGDPGSEEAQLRQARTRLLLGEREAALLELERLAESNQPDLRYLALLFGAREHEREDRPEQAEAGYRAALKQNRRSQAARVGLAALLQAQGRPDDAAELLREGLVARRSYTFDVDPWWVYPQGRVNQYHQRIRALRRQATAP